MGMCCDGYFKGRCVLCGGEPQAYWHRKGDMIFICRQCALNDLPRLIADAVMNNAPSSFDLPWDSKNARLSGALKDVELAYWRAGACAIETKAKAREEQGLASLSAIKGGK